VLVAWTILTAVDLWQVAVRAPASLGAAGVAWLGALYLVATGVGALAGRLAGLRPETTRALLVGGGLALFTVETALRSLPPDSTVRGWVVGGIVLASLVATWALRAPFARHMPAWTAAGALLVLAAGAAGAGYGFGGGRRTEAPATQTSDAGDRPSFLVVVVDTLRADHLGCYGYVRPTTPALDRLASEGALFERAFSQSSWTKPATASLFTGRFPLQHQALYERSRLPEAETTIPEYLRPRAYRTAVLSANPWVTPEYGFDQGVDDFVSVYDERFTRVTLFMTVLKRISQLVDGKLRLYNKVKYLVLGELSTTARDVRLVDAAVAWLGAHGARPFFLYLHMMSPHHPYDPPKPFDRFVPDPGHAPVKNYPRKSYEFFAHGDPLPEPELADMLARYDGDILHADTEIARLLEALDRQGLAQTTIVLVTADHGEEFYDHGNWGHGQSLYNELIRVPLIVRAPGRIPPGTRTARPVMHVDVVPTLLSLAGAPHPPSLPVIAENLLDVVAGKVGAPDRPIVSELLYRAAQGEIVVSGDRKLLAVRQNDELIQQVFDLAYDFAERTPITSQAEIEPLDRLRVDTRRALERARSAAQDATTDTNLDHLRDLGYAE
jgi:arylsulfatase A-like enzyme